MDKKIEKILNDLYMIDGSFKKNEKEVVRIVEELLQSKPDAEVNEAFIEKLHSELVKRAEFLKDERKSRLMKIGGFSLAGKFAYSMAGAVLTLMIVVAGTAYYFNQTKNPIDRLATNVAPGIEKLKDGAFGRLAFNQSKATSGLGVGGGGGPAGAGGSSPSAEQSGKLSMPNPEMVNYRFVYKGGDIPIQDKATVYKRVKNLSTGDKIIESLASLNLGLVDINKFTNTHMSGLSFTEDREFGYDFNIDFREGAVSIYAGLGWPDPNAGCRDEACYQRNQLKESDMPKDEELIAIANKFLDEYQIDRNAYGEGQVMRDYGWYKPLAASSSFYVPETLPVIYPLKINGQAVYDDAAIPTGMAADISIRYKKVMGVRNIHAQKYESSNYAAEQDKNTILSVAEKGGVYGNYQTPEASKTVDVELGTPEIELIATWNYDPEKRLTESLFVPSYVFPVVKVPEGQYYYRKTIIVPMPKEMVDKIIQSSENMPGPLYKAQ